MIESYFKKLRNLASKFLERNEINSGLFLEKAPELSSLIELRLNFLSDHDIEKSSGYSTIGFFEKYSRRERLTCFLILIEFEQELNVLRIDRVCEPYDQNQPIFKKEPPLFKELRKRNSKIDYELLSYQNLEQIDDSEIIKFNSSYFKIPGFIDPLLLTFSRSNFPNSNIYIRLNPYEVFDELPPKRVFEETLVPARPDWWKDLDLPKNTYTGSSYILQDSEPTKENLQKYWDYHVKGIRKLEVYAQRSNSGNLSMILEELSYKNIDSGYVLGKMIHLDTNASRGSSFKSTKLNHLDLAINIYEKERIAAREKAALVKGKVPDASMRTHLFRIEQIPMSTLLLYSKVFFDSKALFREWIIDQFT